MGMAVARPCLILKYWANELKVNRSRDIIVARRSVSMHSVTLMTRPVCTALDGFFLPRDATLSVCLSVRPSVCLYVTFRYRDQ